MSDFPSTGEKFLMDFPLPPSLQEAYGTNNIVIEVLYEGILSDEEVERQKECGLLKEIYNILEFENHHIIKFSGDRWVNDLIGVNSEDVSFKILV